MNSIFKVLCRNLRSALRKQRFEEVEPLLIQLKEIAPTSVETRGFELEYLIKTQRLEEARALGKSLLPQFSASSRIQFLLGLLEYRRKNYGESEHFFSESHRLFNHWHSQYWLGKTLTQLGRYDESEALLEEVRNAYPAVVRDLAWLQERRGNVEKAIALRQQEQQLETGGGKAEAHILRLKAKLLDPEELIEEVNQLKAFGEDIPEDLMVAYVESLFQTAQFEQARSAISEGEAQRSAKQNAAIAWICYRAKAFDMAFSLFSKELGGHLRQYPYLSALENAATKCEKIPELIARYEELVDQAPSLYGRIRNLSKRKR